MAKTKPQPLIPPDLKQCQAEKPDGHNFMTLGGRVGSMTRCNAIPVTLAYEREPDEHGRHGSMSLCEPCARVLEKQCPGRALFTGRWRAGSKTTALDREVSFQAADLAWHARGAVVTKVKDRDGWVNTDGTIVDLLAELLHLTAKEYDELDAIARLGDPNKVRVYFRKMFMKESQ